MTAQQNIFKHEAEPVNQSGLTTSDIHTSQEYHLVQDRQQNVISPYGSALFLQA